MSVCSSTNSVRSGQGELGFPKLIDNLTRWGKFPEAEGATISSTEEARALLEKIRKNFKLEMDSLSKLRAAILRFSFREYLEEKIEF